MHKPVHRRTGQHTGRPHSSHSYSWHKYIAAEPQNCFRQPQSHQNFILWRFSSTLKYISGSTCEWHCAKVEFDLSSKVHQCLAYCSVKEETVNLLFSISLIVLDCVQLFKIFEDLFKSENHPTNNLFDKWKKPSHYCFTIVHTEGTGVFKSFSSVFTHDFRLPWICKSCCCSLHNPLRCFHVIRQDHVVIPT